MIRRIALLFVILLTVPAFADNKPRAVIAESSYDFVKAVRGTAVTHSYAIRNVGDEPLRIEQFRMTTPLRMVRVPTVIQPHATASLEFALDTSAVKGDYEGVILLTLNDPAAAEVELGFKGKVVEKIEVSPIPALFVAVTRGDRKDASLEIINHEAEPLKIGAVESPEELLSAKLETIEPGQRFRLIASLNPKGPVGKHSGIILIHTSSQETPLVRIPANIYFHERVYTFPDAVDMGVLRMQDIQTDLRLTARAAQTLMVYQVSGTKFVIDASTDVPGLRLNATPGPKGDRYEMTLMLDAGKAKPGPLNGSLTIRTNDPQFPVLTVPVTGSVVP